MTHKGSNFNFEDAHPKDVLRWAVDTYGKRLVTVTSFQPTGIVTLHMLSEIAPDTQVFTLDTGLLFPETYQLINTLEMQLNLNLKRIKPQQSVAQQAVQHGDALWERDPDKCCNLRKTISLKNALVGYDAWITGLRRDQSPQRANTPVITWDVRYQLAKLCPFANWTEDMIWTYIRAYDLPYNDLHDQGYPSIGCHTCTIAMSSNNDHSRDGRWANHSKTECGIHLPITEQQ